ncbi:MAG: methionine--tRNA ligase [Rhodospirillaceae bacterium]|nr:methionine--tRNA ligase [Rhodospirillaceae bacterium]
MAAENSYYVTTPIYYVNDAPHIGHAYTTLACDVLARFNRLDGRDVRFLTGTDEHGQKVEKAAEAAGIDPQKFTDEVSANFRKLAEAMNFSFDDFIRTTEERHRVSTQALWRMLIDAGEIYSDSYAGWYAVRDEAFYAEAELEEGPDGTKLAPSGAEVEWVEEPSYFFRLSAWQEPLLAFYEANPDFILPPSRRNEVVSFVKGGLKDLSISRTTFNWGIPVPGDDDHIMYVWLDALTNYITAAGFPDSDCETYQTYWPATLHMVGKDILRFHAVYWPAFLLAAGLEPPKRVFAHGWWTNEGQKISKSLGNVIDPFELVEKYGLDPVRFFMLREVPFGNDGDFSHQAMVGRLNGDLANDLGNLCQRVLSMIAKNCDKQVPEHGAFEEADNALLEKATAMLPAVRDRLDRQSFHNALTDIWQVVGEANRYVDAMAPWALRKEDPDRMATVLYVLAETIRRLGLIVQPFMPDAAAAILDLLAIEADKREFRHFDETLASGTALPKPKPVFPRFVEEETS